MSEELAKAYRTINCISSNLQSARSTKSWLPTDKASLAPLSNFDAFLCRSTKDLNLVCHMGA